MKDTRIEAILACQKFRNVCQQILVVYEYANGGEQLSAQQVRRLLAAIEICGTTASLLNIHAPFTNRICELCAQICELCIPICRLQESKGLPDCANSCANCIHACYAESHTIRHAA